MTALREVKLLKELASPHIVKLMDVFVHKSNLALVSMGRGMNLSLLLLQTSPMVPSFQPSCAFHACARAESILHFQS